MYIYKTTCLVNGKIYIGQCCRKPESSKRYLGSGTAILAAIKKYGFENFKKDILRVCDNQKSLDIWEGIYIKKFNSTDSKIGYNIMNCAANPIGLGSYMQRPEVKTKLNGSGNPMYGKKASEETRKLLSVTNRRPHTEEAKAKISKARTGKAMSEATKEKLRQINTGKKYSEETKKKLSKMNSGKNNPMYGKVFSEEYRKKLSDAAKRRYEKRKR